MYRLKNAAAMVAGVGVSFVAVAAEGAAKAAEPTSAVSSSFSTLLVFAVLGGLGYLFYSVGLLPGGGGKPKH